MRIKRRKELFIETAQTWVIRRSARVAPSSCVQCDGEFSMVAVEEAIVSTGASSRLIHRLIEAGRIHFLEVPDELPFICLDSLLDFIRNAAFSDV
jgi:hypothetical protein